MKQKTVTPGLSPSSPNAPRLNLALAAQKGKQQIMVQMHKILVMLFSVAILFLESCCTADCDCKGIDNKKANVFVDINFVDSVQALALVGLINENGVIDSVSMGRYKNVMSGSIIGLDSSTYKLVFKGIDTIPLNIKWGKINRIECVADSVAFKGQSYNYDTTYIVKLNSSLNVTCGNRSAIVGCP